MRRVPSGRGCVLAAAVLSAACGGGAAPSVPTTTHVVEMRGMKFDPAELRVAVGDTVEWVNRDLLPHTATDVAGAWSSPSMDSGSRWRWVAGESGIVQYRCAFHPTMEASLTVADGK